MRQQLLIGGDRSRSSILSMRRPTTTSTSQQIRATYGTNRGGKSYGQIAREFGVSRSLVQAVLTKPLPPRSRRTRRRRTAGMRPVVVRFPGEDLSRLRVLANSHAQPISALLRAILAAHCRQLPEQEDTA
jgi:hypothetical protein